MANDLPSSHNSLLLNCCIYGTLPPEADNEGNIEYKVLFEIKKHRKAPYFFLLLAQIDKSNRRTT